MPAGDAGLERNHGPLCLARAEQDRLRAERNELQAQFAMEYVRGVEAAIAALHTFSGYVHFARIEQHIRKQCLNAAQAAQSEGEP